MNQLKLTALPFLIIIFLLNVVIAKAQSCEALKNGVFYSYPKNSAKKYIVKRNGDYQYEKDIDNGDSIIYKIEWSNNCKYTLTFISSNAKMTDEENVFWKKHNLVYEITNTTADYYTFKGYIDKTSNAIIQSDTMWLKEKTNVVSNELLQPIKSEIVLKKLHFSDTSKYAVIYIYRTEKFAASQVNMPIYFDDNLICVSKNNSAFIFKILKEGNFTLSALSVNDISVKKKPAVLPLNIRFGQKYYVNSSAKFVVGVLNDYNPQLKLVDAEKGEEEFLNAY